MALYRDLFSEMLTERLEAGGKPDVMTAVVNAYNNCVRDDYAPDTIFTEWLESTVFQCTTCSRSFQAKTLNQRPSPRSEVTCDRCLASSEENHAQPDAAGQPLGSSGGALPPGSPGFTS